MRKYRYLILSGMWIVAAVINYYTERPLKSVGFNLFAAAVFLSLAVLQFIFEGRGENGKKIFRRIGTGYVIALSILMITTVGTLIYNKPDGSTTDSREQLLENLPRGIDWKISTETELSGHIISGIYSRDNKSGIAVFMPNGEEKYRLLARQWRDSDDIIISNFYIEDVWYDVVWFNGAKTDYAEITYTFNGNTMEPVIHNSENMELFINPAPSNDYSLNVVYYDSEGNRYE